MNKDVISPEELQNFQMLENVDTAIIRVDTPGGQGPPKAEVDPTISETRPFDPG